LTVFILGPEKWSRVAEEKNLPATACFILRTREEPAVSDFCLNEHPQVVLDKVESTEPRRDELFRVSGKNVASAASSEAQAANGVNQPWKPTAISQDMQTFTLPVETLTELAYYARCLQEDEGGTMISKLLLEVNSLKLKGGQTSRVLPNLTAVTYLAIMARRLQERLMNEVDKWLQRLEGAFVGCDNEYCHRTQQEAEAHL
uniref:DSPn domain-containing protein n=1 Tax=Schistocephalus solidus TaxID=70667 RepID=A0A183TU32_SCHSO